MNERPADFPLPLPQTKPKVFGSGIMGDRIVLTMDEKPFASFDVAQASIMCCKVMGLCAMLVNRVSKEAVEDAFKQIEKDREKQKPKIILPPSGETAS